MATMSASETFHRLRQCLQSYICNDLAVEIPAEMSAIDDETAIMFLRMKVKPIYTDATQKDVVKTQIEAIEQLYPDVAKRITSEQRAKLFKFLDAMLELC